MVEWLHTLGGIVPALVAVTCLLLSGLGVGWLVVPRSGWRRDGDRHLVAAVTGTNLLGLAALGLGVTGAMPTNAPAVLLPLGALATIACASAGMRGRTLPKPTRQTIGVAAVFAVLGLLVLGPSLCYPTGWDDLVYHVALPRRWLADGRLAVYPDLVYSGFPSLVEILFWFMAPIEAMVAPKLLVWCCWLAVLAMLYRYVRGQVGRVGALVLVVAFGMGRTVLMIASSTYVELFLVADLAALMLLLRNGERLSRTSQWWRVPLVLGVLVGGATATKLTGLILAVVPVAGYVLRCDLRERSRTVRDMAVAGAACAVFALPFYLRPWLATGDPFYPYFAWWFTDEPATVAMSRFHHAIGSAKFGLVSVPFFLSAPLMLAFKADTFDGGFGWQWLAVVVAGLLGIVRIVRRPRRAAFLLPAAAGAMLYLFWFFTSQQARFLAPAIWAFTCSAALGLRALPGRIRQAALAVVLVATCMSLPMERSGYYQYSWVTAFGGARLEDYIHTGVGEEYLPAVDVVFSAVPEDGRLMVLLEHRLLFMPRPAIVGTPYFQEEWFPTAESFATPEAALAEFHRARATHVLMAVAIGGPDQLDEYTKRLEPLARSIGELTRQGNMRQMWASPNHVLLAVRPPRE